MVKCSAEKVCDKAVFKTYRFTQFCPKNYQFLFSLYGMLSKGLKTKADFTYMKTS